MNNLVHINWHFFLVLFAVDDYLLYRAIKINKILSYNLFKYKFYELVLLIYFSMIVNQGCFKPKISINYLSIYFLTR